MTRKVVTHLVVDAVVHTPDKLLPVLDTSTATTVSLDSCGKARPSVRRGDRAVYYFAMRT
jgi:hypothetical protein